jgi:hypothetical protein
VRRIGWQRFVQRHDLERHLQPPQEARGDQSAVSWACALGILAAALIFASLGFLFGVFWGAARRD